MPRTSRAAEGGVVYHVLNRGNGRMGVFRKPGDYLAFLRLLHEGKKKAQIELFGFCLMPNHWHLVLRPKRGKDLPAYLSWVSNTHVKRYRAHYKRTSGHLYQGRYKSFAVQEDAYFLTLLRYVEANPLKTRLVARAEKWPWSSLGCDGSVASELLDAWPLERPADWVQLVNQPLADAPQQRVQTSLQRGRPLGDDPWTIRMAKKLGLQHTLRPRGRPRKSGEEAGK